MANFHVYLDESGDLGFSFNKAYHEGGSSQYLTLAFLLIPKDSVNSIKRIVRDIYNKRKRDPSKELKGSELNISEKQYLLKNVVVLLRQNPNINIFAITACKERVKENIRKDPNKLYNYMIRLILIDKIKHLPQITFIPDKRSIKVTSGNCLVDYLQTYLWYEIDVDTEIEYLPMESHKVLCLQFIDWIAHIIWEKYENKEISVSGMLQSCIEMRQLFFQSNNHL